MWLIGDADTIQLLYRRVEGDERGGGATSQLFKSEKAETTFCIYHVCLYVCMYCKHIVETR